MASDQPDASLAAKTQEMLFLLEEREREVVRLRHGLDDGILREPEEVAKLLDLDLSEVLRVETIAMSKLESRFSR